MNLLGKRILALLLTVVMLVGVVPVMGLCITASAAETYSGKCGENLTWTFDPATGELVIDGTGAMYDYDFYNRPWESYVYEIKTVTISNSVITIGDCAFFECDSLVSVTIGNSVTTIESDAFYSCDSLTSVTIPDSVTSIGDGAFCLCGKLENVEIGNNVTSIGDAAFSWCDILENITVGDFNTAYSSDEYGVLFNKDKTVILKYPSGNERTAYTIPDSVASIDEGAFSGCNNLKGVTISDGVTNIGNYAFGRCAITSITIPDSVTSIGDGVFRDCISLTSVIIGNGVTTIGAEAFNYCTSLASVTIGSSVTAIEGRVFEECNSLTSIEVDPNNEYYSSDSFGVLYNKNKTELIQYPVGNERTSFTIPDSVTGIGYDAFRNCTGIKSITIGDYVTTIGIAAFSNCTSLASVAIGNYVTTIGDAAFGNCISLTDVYYNGTEGEWNEISIYDESGYLLNATIHFLGESEHTHSYSSTVTKEATCKETGVITYTCSCGDTYTEVIPMKEHNMVHDVTPSTCKVAGMEYDFCSGCGETFNVKTLPLNAHTWGEWMVTTQPTGSSEGISTRVCSVCGETETKSIQKLGIMKDEETGIEIEFDDEYGSGVEIKVEEVFDGDSFKIIENACGNNNSEIYDISTIKNGVKIQPDGKVKVRIPVPTGFETTNILVFYIDSTNGTATNIPANVVDGYVEFETDHFSYYAIVEKLGKVNSVSINDISMNYKDSATITPTINADAGVKYTVSYSSSNNDVAFVDTNGRVTTNDTGSAKITVTVTDEYGNTVTDTCEVNISYKWWQWIIVIILFGWIWY